MRCRVQCLLILLLLADLASAATITVRKDGTGDFAVLQQALSAAADGDSVLIGPGEFTEMPWVRIPGWSWDVRACGYITADDLAIVGAGADQTFIGPTVYSGNNSLFSPKGLVYGEGGNLSIQELTVRNCYEGIFMRGVLFLDRCAIENNYDNIYWESVGAGGWIRDTLISASTPSFPLAIDLTANGTGSGILMERCRVEGAQAIIRGARNISIIDCDFTGGVAGISIYDNAQVFVYQCTFLNASSSGIRFSLGSDGYCEIHDSDISGGISALDTGGNATNGRFAVYDSRIRGGTTAALYARYRPGPCVIHNCDFFKGSGAVVKCGPPALTAVIHDLTNNYWGSSNIADIQAWVIDKTDDPSIAATVLYQPFSGQAVPTEPTSWGDLKALFR